jgi:hypothetical protein
LKGKAMSPAEIKSRMEALDDAVAELRQQLNGGRNGRRPWWCLDAGRFHDDTAFEQIVRLGREYRESLRPASGKKRHDRP